MGEFAEQAADVQVALADMAGLALAGRRVVAGSDADPGGQTVRAAEGLHVGANFDEEHGGTDQIDAGDGLEQGQGMALGFQFRAQTGVEACQTRLDFREVLHQFVKHNAVTGGQFPLPGSKISSRLAFSRRLACLRTALGDAPAMIALTMARADGPWRSPTTTP